MKGKQKIDYPFVSSGEETVREVKHRPRNLKKPVSRGAPILVGAAKKACNSEHAGRRWGTGTGMKKIERKKSALKKRRHFIFGKRKVPREKYNLK